MKKNKSFVQIHSNPKIAVVDSSFLLAEGVAEMKSWNTQSWRGFTTLFVVASLFFSLAIPSHALAADEKKDDKKVTETKKDSKKSDTKKDESFKVFKLDSKGEWVESKLKFDNDEQKKKSLNWIEPVKMDDEFNALEDKEKAEKLAPVKKFIDAFAGAEDRNEPFLMLETIREKMIEKAEALKGMDSEEFKTFKEEMKAMLLSDELKDSFRKDKDGRSMGPFYLELLEKFFEQLDEADLEALKKTDFIEKFMKGEEVKSILADLDIKLELDKEPKEDDTDTKTDTDTNTDDGKDKPEEVSSFQKTLDKLLESMSGLGQSVKDSLAGALEGLKPPAQVASNQVGEQQDLSGIQNIVDGLKNACEAKANNNENDDNEELRDQIEDLKNRLAADALNQNDNNEEDNNDLAGELLKLAGLQGQNNDDNQAAQPAAAPPTTPPQIQDPGQEQPLNAGNNLPPEEPQQAGAIPFFQPSEIPNIAGNEQINLSRDLPNPNVALANQASSIVQQAKIRESVEPMLARAQGRISQAQQAAQANPQAAQFIMSNALATELRPLFNKKAQTDGELETAMSTMQQTQETVNRLTQELERQKKARLSQTEQAKLDEFDTLIAKAEREAKNQAGQIQAAVAGAEDPAAQAQAQASIQALQGEVQAIKDQKKSYEKRINAAKEDFSGEVAYRKQVLEQHQKNLTELASTVKKLNTEKESIEQGIQQIQTIAQAPTTPANSGVSNVFGNRLQQFGNRGATGSTGTRGAVAPSALQGSQVQSIRPTEQSGNSDAFRTKFTGSAANTR